jgi:hypothetical protein
MEPSAQATKHDRRSFLGKLGKTFAVGLGVALVASEPALAACDGIICYPVGNGCGGDPYGYCNGTVCGGQCFHCTGCEDFYYCTTHTCTTWCFTSVC